MEKELKTAFYKKFILNLFIIILGITICVVVMVYSIIDYIPNSVGWLPAVLFVSFSICCFIFLVLIIKDGRSFILDLYVIKRNLYKNVTGIVVRIKKEDQGGDAVTYKYYPIVLDDDTGEQVKLDVIDYDVEISHRYSFIYLPHTRLAVVTKVINNTFL